MKLKIFLLVFSSLLLFGLSCRKGGTGIQIGNFIIYAPSGTEWPCEGGGGISVDQEFKYEIRIFTYDDKFQPVQYGETTRRGWNKRRDKIELFDFKFPESGQFFIQITLIPRYCSKFPYNLCESYCGKQFGKFTSPVLENKKSFIVNDIDWKPDGYECCD